MSLKRKWLNFPTTDKGGHYFYYDEGDATTIIDSDSFPPNLDKFNSSALYTSVQDSLINKTILKYGLGKISESQITINSLKIENNGVGKPIAKTRLDVWLFDDLAWNKYRDEYVDSDGNSIPDILPEEMTEGQLYKALYKSTSGRLGEFGKWMSDTAKALDSNAGATSARIFRYRPGDIGEGKGMGEVVKDGVVLSGLVDVLPPESELDSSQGEPFSSEYSFNTTDGEDYGSPILQKTDQFIYFVIRTSGDGRRDNRKDKSRNKRYTIYKIPSTEFFTSGNEKADVYDLTPIKKIDGGGKYKTAFKVDNFEIFVDTRATETQDYPDDDTGQDYTWGDGSDKIPNYNINELTEVRAAVQEPVRMNLRNLFQEFRNQSPEKEIRGHKFINSGDNDSFSGAIATNFEPVAKVNILGNSDYDLSAYQRDEIAKQICSAPNQIELGFYISEYFDSDGVLTQTDGYGLGKWEGYKFYVVDWDDEDNKFDNPQKYLDDIPQNDIEMLDKQNQNLYKFADLSETLVHNYSTPGMKIIKAVLFSHLPNYEKSQIVRWKFIETRIFLDIPVTKYPDFGELGGQDFTTIPWPYTTPIIGGISENSKYKISVQNTLSGGKLAANEIIDIRFLEEANENDELGKSITKMDLEQVRYFNTGSLDMTQLLKIPIVINETEMQDIQVGESFSDDAYPGPKYIAWNEDTNACRETQENGQDDLDGNGINYDYLCASEYPDVPFITTGGADNAGSATNCCYSKFGTPPLYHQWIAETCGNNGIIDGDPYGGGYKSYECRLALFEEQEVVISSEFRPHTDADYWDCRDWDIDRNYCFSEETSVGQIFIDDNSDLNLKENCVLELNLGELDGKILSDTNGNPNKGVLIGDYKVKKRQKNVRMKRDSFIKLPKKGTSDGAL
jgi:hypothetical protein